MEPLSDVFPADCRVQLLCALFAVFSRHDDRLVQSFHCAFKVCWRHANCAIRKLLVNAAAVGEHQHAVIAVYNRTFFGHQVHALNDGIHQEHVIQLHTGDGLGVIVLNERHYGLPLWRAQAGIDLLNNLLNLVHVPLVLPDVGTGGHQEGQELNLTLQLRVAV